MSKIWTRGVIAALGLLIALPAVGSAHAHYTGIAPAAVKASLVSTHAHATVQLAKHKKKHKRKHKSKKTSLRSKVSAHAKQHRVAAGA